MIRQRSSPTTQTLVVRGELVKTLCLVRGHFSRADAMYPTAEGPSPSDRASVLQCYATRYLNFTSKTIIHVALENVILLSRNSYGYFHYVYSTLMYFVVFFFVVIS